MTEDKSGARSKAEEAYVLFSREFAKESERAKVILSAAMLDEALVAVLRAHLVPCPASNDQLFDGANALLSTFSARIDFCYRLGLISGKFARDLHLIRKIRNQFAHNVSGCNFSDSAITNRVTELRQSFATHFEYERTKHQREYSTPLEAFAEVVGLMIVELWSAIETMSSLTEAAAEFFYMKNE
jgi:DNA-binding MltR family transcriptional regulator